LECAKGDIGEQGNIYGDLDLFRAIVSKMYQVIEWAITRVRE
jgi:hypothetical protein